MSNAFSTMKINQQGYDKSVWEGPTITLLLANMSLISTEGHIDACYSDPQVSNTEKNGPQFMYNGTFSTGPMGLHYPKSSMN